MEDQSDECQDIASIKFSPEGHHMTLATQTGRVLRVGVDRKGLAELKESDGQNIGCIDQW